MKFFLSINPIRPHKKALDPHGVMTRSILRTLREFHPAPQFTTVITIAFLKAANSEMTSKNIRLARSRVSARLNNMVHSNKLLRRHEVVTTDEGLWELAPILVSHDK